MTPWATYSMDAMQVDGGASSGCAPLRALALELHEVGEALQEAVDKASALLGPNGRHEPLTVDNETLLAYARAVCRVRAARCLTKTRCYANSSH